MPKKAIKIENIKRLCATDADILRIIALKLGEKDRGFVDYKLIARSLNIERDTVRKAINRMVRRKVLQKENGELSIPGAITVE